MSAAVRAGRTSIKGKHRVPKKYKSKQFDYRLRLDAINYLDAHGMRATVARFFGEAEEYETCRLRVTKWKKNREFILAACATAKKAERCRVRPQGVGTVLPREAEVQLCQWVDELRQDGVPVSASLFRSRALETASDYGLSPHQFKASKSWRLGFLRRHKLSFRSRTHQGQQTVEAAEKIADEFAAEVRREIAAKGIVNVLNADQTAAFFEVLPKKTLAPTGSRTVWVRCGKKEKQRATVMLTADIKGKKYSPFIVFKVQPAKSPEVQELNTTTRHGFGRDLWKQMESCQAPFDVHIYGNKTAWWNEELSLRYLDYMFADRCPTSPPIMLLLDHFSGHWTAAVEQRASHYGIVLKKIPAGLTWRSQPADVAWIKPFKDSLRRAWIESLRAQLAEYRRQRLSTPFTLRPPSRADVVRWVSNGWKGLKERTVIAGFRKCKYTASAGVTAGGEDNGDDPPETNGEDPDASDVVVALEEHGETVGRALEPTSDILDNENDGSDEEVVEDAN